MSARDERVMISEQIAPGMLPRVLNTFDMVVIFVAIVLFIVQASVVQGAGGPVAFSYLILGFLFFLIPGALVTAQLGQMFPHEGSLYVWTHKALGPFWGFFAGFCAWWPGVLVMPAIGVLVVTLLQSMNPHLLGKTWEQGLVILAVIWFSAIVALLRFRLTQNYVNLQFVFYAVAIFIIGLAGVVWLAKGHPAANSFALSHFFKFNHSNYTFFGFVILALLGIEVPLNMGVEIVHGDAIKKYLFWGSIVVMAAYLWATFGNMAVVPVSQNNSRVPDVAVIVQSILASALVVPTFILLKGGDTATKVYLAFQGAVTVIWCLSMILLFSDVFIVRKWFPEKFEEVRTTPLPLLMLSGVVGAITSAFGAYVVFTAPFGPVFKTNAEWRTWVGILTGGSALIAVLIYLISEATSRRNLPEPAAAPVAGGSEH